MKYVAMAVLVVVGQGAGFKLATSAQMPWWIGALFGLGLAGAAIILAIPSKRGQVKITILSPKVREREVYLCSEEVDDRPNGHPSLHWRHPGQ